MSGIDKYRLPDEDIIPLILKGAKDQYGLIVKRYQGRIFGIGMRFFHNEEDASDFVQDVFVRAYENLGSFKGTGIFGQGKFSSWLLKIAYNYGINSLKRTKRYVSLADAEEPVSKEGPPEIQKKGEIKKALKDALGTLPEKYAICLDLYFFYGVSYPDISEITGFPVNTIKSHVFRAKGLLRKTLKGTDAEDYHEL